MTTLTQHTPLHHTGCQHYHRPQAYSMQAPDSVALALVVHSRGTKALSTFTLGQQTREVWSASVVLWRTTAIALHPSGSIGVDLTSNLA
jgi:hypothetical protein